MTMDERYIAAIDLGTSKIAVTVAQVNEKGVQIIYYRESPSDGIRNSYVINPQKASQCLKSALQDAENELKMKIHSVVTSLPRYEVKQLGASAKIERSDPNSCISKEEIDFLKTSALETYPLDDPSKQIMYGIVAQSFTTDDYFNSRESDIEGMVSDSLEGNFKVFVGNKRYSDNVDRVMNLAGISIAKNYFAPDVTGRAVLSDEERENGTALIEIGAGVSSVSVFHNDILRYYASIPFGGKSITTDIKLECGTSETLAENIKLAYGACMPEKLLTLRDKIIQINNNESGSCKQLSVKYLSEVISCRIKEIIDACLYKIQESGLSDCLRNGIVLTGGAASLPNLSTYVKELSGYNIRIGYPRHKFSYQGCPEVTETSAVASVGLIMAAKEDTWINCTYDLENIIEEEDKCIDPEEEKKQDSVQEATETSSPETSTSEDQASRMNGKGNEKEPEEEYNDEEEDEKGEDQNDIKNSGKNPKKLSILWRKFNEIISNGYEGMNQ